MLVIDLVTKALARSKSFSLIFIFNFALAIASLSYLQFFKSSIDSSLETEAKSLLGADLVVNSRFPISDQTKEDILAKLPPIKDFSETISTISMIASQSRARLLEIVRIDEGFPFYGGVVFKDNSLYPSTKNTLRADEIWVYKEVLDLLNLQVGDPLKIGKEYFTIQKVIQKDSLKAISFSGFMPKIYISKQGLERTELLQFGSTARYKLNYLFEEDFTNQELETLENKIEKTLDHNLHILSPNDGRDRLLRVLNFVTNFLSLVSLISFFLGLVGLIYLYSGFLRKHQNDITILRDLGLTKMTLALTYLGHLFILIAIASSIVFAFITLSGEFLAPIIQQFIDFQFDFSLQYMFFFKSAVILALLSVAIGLPLILPLLSREKTGVFRTIGQFIPFLGFLFVLAHFVTPTQNVGLYFALAIFVLICFFFFLGFLILKKIDFSGHFQNLSISLAIKNITRQKSTSLTLFSAIVLCTTFFSLIPQIGSSLSSALSQSVAEKPRFFIVDAQESQIEALETHVEKRGAKLENIAPMIRGQIIQINDIDFSQHALENGEKSDKEQRNALKNSTVNLSYRNHLKASEEIVEGVPFSGIYDSADFSKPIEISIEKRYAKRRGIVLEDYITFDVLGMELKGVVVNIRSVTWTEFVPNFFFIVQDGVLNDAPKTILATISEGNYDATKMIISLSYDFPSLTVIDVKNLFESFLELVENVTFITEKMSIYSIFIGLLMSFIIIQYQINLQKNNIVRLKMIGINNSVIRNVFLIQFGFLATVASSLGIILGSIGSYFISKLLFDSYWDFRPDLLALYFFFIPLLTLAIVSFFTSRIIDQKENILFGE